MRVPLSSSIDKIVSAIHSTKEFKKKCLMEMQCTVAKPIEVKGIALHSGEKVTLKIKPAPVDHGIAFRRVDVEGKPTIPATVDRVVSTQLCTTLSSNLSVESPKVSTIEHLMAALSGLGISNALIDLDGPEVPILDGSSTVFVRLILDAGTCFQMKKKKIIKIERKLSLQWGDRYMCIEPCKESSPQYSYRIDFPCKTIGNQEFEFSGDQDTFLQRVAKARTFCHMEDVDFMKSQGLALGGSLDNAVVFDDKNIINNEGLRDPKEFVLHKILDCIGDLSLLGVQLQGKITVHKGGHTLHHVFAKALARYLSTLTKKDSSPGEEIKLEDKELWNGVGAANVVMGNEVAQAWIE